VDTIAVNVNSTASSAGNNVYISVSPDQGTSSHFFIPNPTTFRILTGSLPGGRKLTQPLVVRIEYDDDEVVVSETRFHIHASASTEEEAIAAFRRIFPGFLDLLASHEDKLDSYLQEQLAYLRSYITTK